MIPCFGYTRVSTVKQGEGVSLEAQKDAITHYAERHGLSVTKWFEEKETAAKAGRPVFNALVKDLKAGKAQGLITHKIDRSARNFRDWALIGDLADAGISIHFATETLDFSSRGGRLAADVQAVVAADYIRNLREESIKGMRGRLKQGLYPFKAPLGYLDQGRGKAKTPDPERRQLVQEMFDLYASGQHSFRSLQEEMKSRGLVSSAGRPLNRGAIENMLSNPFYCGILRLESSGETFKGVHEPLISVATFQRVQDVKTGKCGKKITRHGFTYRKLFTCSLCKYRLIAERQKGQVYYRCHTKTCPMTGLREDILEQNVYQHFHQSNLPSSVQRRLSTSLRQGIDARNDPRRALAQIDMQLAEAEDRLVRLTDAMLDQLIDTETFQKRRNDLIFKQQRLAEEREKIERRGSELNHLLKFLELSKSLAGLYKIANPAEKRVLVEILTSNRRASPNKVEIEPAFALQNAFEETAASYGDPSRAKSRTTPMMRKSQPSDLRMPDLDLSITDLVEQLSRIFEKYGNTDQKPDNAI
jgi:DNA invertase Pin-like site-specific DNA recombinase